MSRQPHTLGAVTRLARWIPVIPQAIIVATAWAVIRPDPRAGAPGRRDAEGTSTTSGPLDTLAGSGRPERSLRKTPMPGSLLAKKPLAHIGRLAARRPEPRYALLACDVAPGNIGDAIQSIAAEQFLPRVDAWADRERLDEFRGSPPHKIILNGWFLHRPDHWPPSSALRPLVTSFHLTKEVNKEFNLHRREPSTEILGRRGIKFLKRHEPIGARDLDTCDRLESAGVEAYFSGCLTLTLERDAELHRDDVVYAVDLPPEVVTHLRENHTARISELTHAHRDPEPAAQLATAKGLLGRYASARAVVTTRLHCALPCLALGTPVLFLEAAPDTYRFDGLRELFHRSTCDAVLEDDVDFDLDDPPPNSDEWRPIGAGLRAICERFIADAH